MTASAVACRVHSLLLWGITFFVWFWKYISWKFVSRWCLFCFEGVHFWLPRSWVIVQCQPGIHNFHSQLSLYSEMCLINLCLSAASPFLKDLTLRGWQRFFCLSLYRAFIPVVKNLSCFLFKSGEWREGVTWAFSLFLLKFLLCSYSSRRPRCLMHTTFMVAKLLILEFLRKMYRLSPSSWTSLKRYELIIRTWKQSFPFIPLYTSQTPKVKYILKSWWKLGCSTASLSQGNHREGGNRELDVVPKPKLGLDCLICSSTPEELCSTNFIGFCPIT